MSINCITTRVNTPDLKCALFDKAIIKFESNTLHVPVVCISCGDVMSCYVQNFAR